jgi:enterochelin esterase-like enzyme
VPKGVVTRHVLTDSLRLVGGRREAWLYRPPIEDPAALLIVLDGQDYLRRGRLPVILDTLIAEHRIRPLAALMIKHGGSARAVEYGCNGATVEFVRSVAVPFAQETCGIGLRGEVAILGASMGGLLAVQLGVSYPDVFATVLSQSGAFRDGYGYGLLERFIGATPATKIRLWFDVGRYEGLLPDDGRARDLLVGHGYDLTYREYSGGHNYTCWRNELEHGLSAMFPR